MGEERSTESSGFAGKRKRKTKNNKFLYTAKKKMKAGRFDILDGETYEYFLRIGEAMKGMASEAEDDKEDFCANVLKEAAGKEWDVMKHAMSSRILETLIPWSRWEDLEGLREAARDKRSWEGQGCPAHVLEVLIKDSARRTKEDRPEKVECIKFLETKSRFFLNNLEQQIWETNANHVTRTCLLCCSETDEDRLHEIVKEATLYVMGWGQLNDHFNNPLISAFLQSLIQAVRRCAAPTCDKLLKHLRKAAFKSKSPPNPDTGLPEIFSDEPLSMLLECAVSNASEKMYLKLYTDFFKDNLLKLAELESNFALVKLISSCPDKFIFEEIFSSLLGSAEISKIKLNVLSAISERCVTLATKQGEFIQKIKVILGCDKKEDRFVPCLLRFRKLADFDDKSPTDKNGSIILQNIFKFNKPIKVVESFLSLDVQELMDFAADPKASWVFDSFFASSSIGEKSRARLVSKFRGRYLSLAGSKFGSRVFDGLWGACKAKDREQIMSELDRTLLSSPSGRVISMKIDLELYLTNKKSWLSKQTKH